MCDGVCSSSCIEKCECANERIPRRHALATSHWQRYVSDQNTVAKYRPCSSTFLGIVHFAHCPKFLAGQGHLRRKIFPAGVMDLFESINREGQTILMVTHSIQAASHASRVLFIKDGEVYHQIYRGMSGQREMLQKISDTLTLITAGREEA